MSHDEKMKWFREAMTFARSITDHTGPRTSRANGVMSSTFANRVPLAAQAAFKYLQPYLDDLNRIAA